jgi:hypothetical protein
MEMKRLADFAILIYGELQENLLTFVMMSLETC